MNDSQADYIQYRIQRSDEFFKDAELLADNGRWQSCVNRLYYSSFHLIDALLSLDGISAKTHEGLKTKFLQLYVKTDEINKELGKLYSQLLDWRHESDYSIFVEFDRNEVLPLIQRVRNLNEILLEKIKSKS
ncbi:MAG TPA: HEPN domain-containing protein [Bacteroides sp.]|nr:HEPN domain-containing protein [Bacteroides sp.]